MDNIIDGMLTHLLDLDILRGKCTKERIQGGISGKMKRAIISLIEELHVLDAAVSGSRVPAAAGLIDKDCASSQTSSERFIRPCKCSDYSRKIKELEKENALIGVKLDDAANQESSVVTGLRSEKAFLEKEVLLRDRRIHALEVNRPAAHGRPTIKSVETLVPPVKFEAGRPSSPFGGSGIQVTVSQVETIVVKVLGRMGIGSGIPMRSVTKDRMPAKPLPTPVDNLANRLAEIKRKGEWPCLPQTSVQTDRVSPLSAAPVSKKKRRRKKKVSLAEAEAKQSAVSRGGGLMMVSLLAP